VVETARVKALGAPSSSPAALHFTFGALAALAACAKGAPPPVEPAPPAPREANALLFADISVDGGAAADSADAGSGADAPKVTNIGMHIGGGPNDDETKAPIARSVAPHLADMGGCFAATDGHGDVDLRRHPVEFGVDLTIEAAGGKAGVANPRTTWRNAAFVHCVVDIFKTVDFERPRTGRSIVSYSVRFTPSR
jgi:hypothetical protein